MPGFVRPVLTIVALLATAFSMAACGSVGAAINGTSAAQLLPVHGIDVSKYQGRIDWQQVAQSGVKFAYLKATEGGDRKDEMFAMNWAGARAAGIPTGAYHFYYFCRPVDDQIAWFQTHVPPAPDALPPVLDMEWNAQSKTCKSHPPAEQIRADMRRFLAAMKAFYGKEPVVYTDIGFHRDILASGDLPDVPFWLRSVKAHPNERYSNRGFAFWQYTATGRVPGIRGNVDQNAFAGTQSQWNDFLRSNNARGTAFAAAMPANSQPVVLMATAPAPVAPAIRTSTLVAAAPPEDLLPPMPEAAPTYQDPAVSGVY